MKLLPLAVALTVAVSTVAGSGTAASAADAGSRSIFVEIVPTDVLKGVALSSLLGKYVIIVHKSTKDMDTYVSCGAIR
jgi:hypothetical protein